MAYATLSTYDEVLKTFYLPAIQEQLNHDTPLADIIEVNEEDVSGKDAKIEMHYGRNTGIGARQDGVILPTATYQKFLQATVPMKYNYGRVSFTGPTIAATRDERGAYARVIDTEITGMVTDVQKEVNRQLWGCGYGILARWYATGAATTYQLQRLYRSASYTSTGFGSTFGVKYLKELDAAVPVVLDSMSSASGAGFTVDTTNIVVSGYTEGTGSTVYDTITCTNPTVTEAEGTFYVRPRSLGTYASATAAGADAATGGHRGEMMGLRGIVSNERLDAIACNDGTYTGIGDDTPDWLQQVNGTTYAWFNATVDAHSAGRYGGQRAVSDKLLQKMFDKCELNAGKDIGPNLVLTTQAIRREIVELWTVDRRFVNEMEFDGGWKGLEFNGIPIIVDPVDAIDGEIYFLTTKDIQCYRMSDYDWMSKDGAILSRISGYDAYEAILFRYAELGVKRRNTQGVLADIAYEAD